MADNGNGNGNGKWNGKGKGNRDEEQKMGGNDEKMEWQSRRQSTEMWIGLDWFGLYGVGIGLISIDWNGVECKGMN
jgi:hypothetical protein